jgi:site-specific DNA-methyltransferase (adenine-specific)
MKDWIEKGYHEITGTGFMGKEWDAFIPQPLFWKEAFRVLKHGGHVLSFFGSRTYDWGVMSMRFANFEVRDTITWHFGSGFPKSHNVGKSVDKIQNNNRQLLGVSNNTRDRNNHNYNSVGNFGSKEIVNTKGNSEWEGWGTALKPASEYIVLARKPLEKGLTIAENVLKWGTGAINIDGCRVGISDKVDMNATQKNFDKMGFSGAKETDGISTYNPQGRFPANIILTHHEDCECIGTKKVKAIKGGNGGSESMNEQGYGFKKIKNGANAGGLGDENGEETIENWNCVDDCPIKILDEQSGESKSSNTKRSRNTIGSFGMPNDNTPEYSDKGGASRFFYVAKASKSERNKGLDGFDGKQVAWSNQAKAELKRGNTEFADDTKMHNKVQERVNFHPTVKPIKLMQYLVRLITPPNGIVLDPFCGSGTTGVACKLEGFQFVGLEQDAEYSKIAQARIDNYVEEKPTMKKSIKTEEIEPNQLDIFNSEL